MVRDHKKGKDEWIPGKIHKDLVPGVTYEVIDDNGRHMKRHANQIIKRSEQATAVVDTSSGEGGESGNKSDQPELRRSARLRDKQRK